MAEINEELIEQLKKIAASLEDSSEYTEEMQEAMRSMQSTMRAVVDLSKTMSEQSDAMAENFGVIVDSLSKISAGTREISDEQKKIELSIAEEKLLREQIRTNELLRAAALKENREELRAQYELRTQTREVDNAITTKAKEHYAVVKSIGDALLEGRKLLVETGYEYDKITGKMKERKGAPAAVARGAMAAHDAAAPALTGLKNIQEVVGSIGSKLAGLAALNVGAAGVGGILGMIIDAVQRRENFEAFGQQASQAFDALGSGGDRAAGKLAGLTRALTRDFAASQQAVQTVTRAFAEMNVTAEEAMQTLVGVKTGYGNELLVATMSVDKAFEMADGTMAKLAGTMARDFNMSTKEAFINLTNVGSAAKEAGLNAAQFMQQITSAASALKLLNINGEAFGTMQLNLVKSMRDAGFGKQFSAQYAGAGMQSAAGAIAGMSEGFSAIIGERLGLGSGIDALMAMKDPTSRGAGSKLDMVDIMKEMRGIAQEAGSTPNEQKFFLMKTMGVDASGANAIMNAMDEVAKTGELSEATQKEVARGLKSESEKTSDLVRAVEMIKDGFLDIGLGLLQALVGTTKAIYGAIMQMYSTVMSWVNKGDQITSEAYARQAVAYGTYRDQSMDQAAASLPLLAEGVKKLKTGGFQLADQFTLDDSAKARSALANIDLEDSIINLRRGQGKAYTGKDVGRALLPMVPGVGPAVQTGIQVVELANKVVRVEDNNKSTKTDEQK